MASLTSSNGVSITVTASTRYIISTSGRATSLKRYKHLLQTLLKLDVAYIPISNAENGPIKPEMYAAVLRGMNCIGGAISKDIKHGIIPFLDELDDSAAGISSVNTVIVRRSSSSRSNLIGYNTDVIGFKVAVSKACELLLSRKQVVIKSAVCYGYGGVTSVVVDVSILFL